MPWLSVNHTRLCRLSAVPTPLLALEVQRGEIPGQPGAKRSISFSLNSASPRDRLPAAQFLPLSGRVAHPSGKRFYQVLGVGRVFLPAAFKVVLVAAYGYSRSAIWMRMG